MTSFRSIAWLLLVILALGACTSTGTRRTAKPAAASPSTRVEVRTEPVPPPAVAPLPTPVSPPPPSAPTPSPSLSVGPARPPEPTPPPAAVAIPDAPTPPPAAPSRNIVFNFDNADVEVVIQAAAEIVGFNYVLAPAARGRKVTVQTIGKIANNDVFNVLLTILDVNGLAAVKSGNLYRIIPKEGAPQSSIRTVVGREADPSRGGDEVLTQLVPLRYISAVDAVSLLRPFVPQQGAISAHRETNLLIITDTAANIRRVLDIVKLVDVEVAVDELQIIPLRHSDAQELAQLLNQMFSTGRLRTGVGAVPPGAPTPPPPVPGAPVPPAIPPSPTTPTPDRPLIVAERRSNSLVIHARKAEMDTIRKLIEKLDVDIYGGQRVFIYFVENTKAKDLAATLDAIYGRPGRTGAQTTQPRVPSQTPGGLPTGGLTTPPPPPIVPGPASFPIGPGPLGEAAAVAADLRFIADEVTNALIVTTYPRLWRDIEDTIKKLDRMARQVLIEVLAAEVTLTDDTKLGIEWALRSGKFTFTNTQNKTGTLPSLPPTSIIPGAGSLGGGTVLPVGFNMFTFVAKEFIAALNALASENKVNVLSSPSIMTSENKKAIINVSTSVPIVTSQQVPVSAGGSTGNSITQAVEYKDAGIILTVTPRIGEQGTVALDIKQEVNEVGEPEPPPINSPRFTKREAETSVVLLNNQTLVLGGLIQNKRTFIRTGIPLLNRIPVLGYLFGATEEKIEKTELLLLVTPRVIGTAVDAARVTEQMKRVTPEIEESIRRAPRLPPPTSVPPAFIPPPPTSVLPPAR
jgi:general secretion pathway protein D